MNHDEFNVSADESNGPGTDGTQSKASTSKYSVSSFPTPPVFASSSSSATDVDETTTKCHMNCKQAKVYRRGPKGKLQLVRDAGEYLY